MKKNVKKDKKFEKVAIYQWRVKQSIGRASFLSYLRINSGVATFQAAANDTENDILFRGVNRRKNRSSRPSAWIFYRRVNSEMTGFIVWKFVENCAKWRVDIFYLVRTSFRQSGALIVVPQWAPPGRFSRNFYLTDGRNSLFGNV